MATAPGGRCCCLRPPGSRLWNPGLRAAAGTPSLWATPAGVLGTYDNREFSQQFFRAGIFTHFTGEEKGSERSGDPPRPAARSQTPDPRHVSLPVLVLSQGDWLSRPQESPALAGPQLRASLAFLAVNPTGAAANPVEERARLSARLCFVKGAPQARQDSGLPTGPPKPRKPRWGQPLLLLLQEVLPARLCEMLLFCLQCPVCLLFWVVR